jgi:hypothetical protein
MIQRYYTFKVIGWIDSGGIEPGYEEFEDKTELFIVILAWV